MGKRNYHLNDVALAQIDHVMKNAEDEDVRQKAKAIFLLHSGESAREIAEDLSVSVATIYNWHTRWSTDGITGLGYIGEVQESQVETAVQYNRAKEILGKWVTIRKEPHVRAEAVDRLEPHSIVNFIEIVPDKKNPKWEWLKLSEGNYVNYDYPPSGLRYKLLPNIPELPVDHYVLTAFDADNNEIQRKILVELK